MKIFRISDICKIKAGKTETINSLVCFLNSDRHVSITQKHSSLVYYNIEKPKLSTGKMLWVRVLKWAYMSSFEIGIGSLSSSNTTVIHGNTYHMWGEKMIQFSAYILTSC